ncbi:MAG: hypothetical protein KatS3mg102_1566 [Planctomycetota bacterium]|nr:MAG: hypothetical protein KatS3mg102_1566 [Planctomycetota bacterium]
MTGVLDSFAVPSEEQAVLPAVERVLAAVRAAGYLEGEATPLKVALVELLRNAMEHGNRFVPQREVAVTVACERERIAVTVADEGPGLDPARLAQSLSEQAPLEAPRGRGLGMVRRLLGEQAAIEVCGSAITIRFGRERFARGR